MIAQHHSTVHSTAHGKRKKEGPPRCRTWGNKTLRKKYLEFFVGYGLLGLLLIPQVPPPLLLRREVLILLPLSLQPLVLELLETLLPLRVRHFILTLRYGVPSFQRLLLHPWIHLKPLGGVSAQARKKKAEA